MTAHKGKIKIPYTCFLEHKISEDMGKRESHGMAREIGPKNHYVSAQNKHVSDHKNVLDRSSGSL